MFEAKFGFLHHGCFTQELSAFKSSFVTYLTVCENESSVEDVIEVTLASENERSLVKDYFSGCPVVSRFLVLEEDEKKMLIQVFTDTSKIRSVVHTVISCGCFVPRKVFLSGGREVWTIAAPEKGMIEKALSSLSGFGEVELLYLRKGSLDGFGFSRAQEDVLMKAVRLGYYSWPRRISATELARRLKMSKATLLEHLRKAEIKVMKMEFSDGF